MKNSEEGRAPTWLGECSISPETSGNGYVA